MVNVMGKSVTVITNKYPSAESRYQNAFVHTRVLAYQKRGVDVRVIVIDPAASEPAETTFEGVSVTHASSESAGTIIRLVNPSAVAIHFVSQGWFNTLRSELVGRKVFIWMHGFEVEAWYRRWFNTDLIPEKINKLLLRRRAAFRNRKQFLQELAIDEHLDIGFITVSKHFRDHVVAPDTGIPPEAVAVIPNPIQTELFVYQPKTEEQRFQVLTIRPFTSAAYGNDLLVSAIKKVISKDSSRFHFTIIGDGEQFESTLSELRSFPQVTLRQAFLTPEEIASEHSRHGIFLAPGRIDSQGVSRCEAMSSGLVPIANDVAAVAEFIHHEVDGLLAPSEDADALASALLTLAEDQELFMRLSTSAAENIRETCSLDTVIDHELSVLFDSGTARQNAQRFAGVEPGESTTVSAAEEMDQAFAAALFAAAQKLRSQAAAIVRLEASVEKKSQRISAFEGSFSRAKKRQEYLEKELESSQRQQSELKAELKELRERKIPWKQHAIEAVRPVTTAPQRVKNLAKRLTKQS